MKQQRMIQSTTLICGALSMALRCLQNGANVDAFSVARHHRVPRRHHIALMEGSQPRSELTDWVIAGLEDKNESITSTDPIKAGEGDTIPTDGLVIGNFRILPSGYETTNQNDNLIPIKLLAARNGWGTGIHPTTRLCLEWVASQTNDGDVLLDYGCGSGILSIAALNSGASKCIGIDVEAEALITAERNVALNGWETGRFEGLHTREVLPYEVCPPRGASLCVANILVGQLVRPSMVAAIVTNLEPGGFLCLSGIRPGEVDSLKEAYGDSIDWIDSQYAELSAEETMGCIESYGFDCGRWARLVGRKKVLKAKDFIDQMSDLAVS